VIDEMVVDNQNIASDNAHVEQQVGVLIESIVHNSTTYQVAEDDTAERKHEVALAYLAGGVPRRAEALLHDLVFTGRQTTERVYYYVLAVVSGRGFADLTGELVERVGDAWKLRASLPEDEWSAACDVVRRLLEHVHTTSDGALGSVAAFAALPGERQDEITRHLERVVDGVVERQLDAERKNQVDALRLGGDRAARAPLFFEPEPAPPVRYQSRFALPNLAERRNAAIGCLVALAALGSMFVGSLTLPFWAGLVALLGGAVVMARFGIDTTAAALVRSALGRPAADEAPSAPTRADRLIDRCFEAARPHYAADWPRYAAGYKARLKQRFAVQLQHDDQHPNRYKWLFDWHARHVADHWPQHDLPFHAEPANPANARVWQLGGAVATVVGTSLLLAADRFQVLVVLAGAVVAWSTLMEVIATRRAASIPRKQADALHTLETAEYQRWCEELTRRPSDSEMARWLALDKSHLKAEALRAGNIDERDLVSHVVIAQLAPGARRGTVAHGPPRYTAYQVTVILLTRHGVRSSQAYLNFTTGEVKDRTWNAFGYDRISSASLSMKEGRSKDASTGQWRKTRSRQFSLRLLDTSTIIEISERTDLGSDTVVEDEEELERLAAETSGLDAALPVMEAIAHHGRAWIELEDRRRGVWAEHWAV
jgi:hypothetical protein